MKYLVLGANGMAGHMICAYLDEQNHDVTGFARTSSKIVPTIVGDARDSALIRRVIESGSYDAVVNAIGILNRDAEENKGEAVLLNSWLPHYLSSITKGTSTRIVHLSTDCVFAGNTGPYTEKSEPDGASFYDKSKALGELSDSDDLTLRQSLVGPDINETGIGLLNWFMQQHAIVNGFTGAIWTGLTTLELSRVIDRSMQLKSSGIIQAVPSGRGISKYELLGLFNTSLRSGKVEIRPVCEPAIDKSLVQTDNQLCKQIQPYEQQVEDLAGWIERHPKMYPDYYYQDYWK